MNHKSFRINLKRNYSTRSSITWRGSIIGDWLEPFVFTVICPGFSIDTRSLSSPRILPSSPLFLSSFSPSETTLAHFHPSFPFFFSSGLSSLIYIPDVGIDQPPLYHDKTCTPRFIAVPHYGDTSARGFAGINCHSNRRQSPMTVVVDDDAEKLKGLLDFSYVR